jgi:ubiquinone/menaquinone biosynthesis C-methylase UbiE
MTSHASEAEGRAAALFDALAPQYDAVGVDFFQPIAEGLLSAIESRPGETWLDLGCGSGAVLLPLARRIDPGRATGLDISPAMVTRTREEATGHNLRNVDVVVGSAQLPDLPAASFDGITCSLVLFFLTDPRAALESWRPLLKPGGRIGVTTFGPTDPRWRHVEEVLQPFLPPRDARSSGVVGPFESDEGMESLVVGAGFCEVHTVSQIVDVHFDSADQWRDFSMSVGQRQAWLAIPDAQREEVFAEAASRFRAVASPDGSADFTQVARHTLAVG